MVDAETQAHIQDLVEVFSISEEQAKNLVDAHDNFVESLAELDNHKAAVMVAISTAAALASHSPAEPNGHEGITPITFIKMVEDVLLTLAYDPVLDSIGEA